MLFQIILLFGCITVAFSFVMLAYMPDSPIEAKFLEDEDKLIAIERLRMNQMGVMSREWRWDHAKEACLDLKTWGWFAMLFSISIPLRGISTFGPLIVQSFGLDAYSTILFNIPFGFVQLCRYPRRRLDLHQDQEEGGLVIAGLCIPPSSAASSSSACRTRPRTRRRSRSDTTSSLSTPASPP